MTIHTPVRRRKRITAQDRIVEEAKALIGIRYKDKGRDVLTGVDCAGMLKVISERNALSKYDSVDYGKRPSGHQLKTHMDSIPELETLQNKWDWESGDIGVFASLGQLIHLGVLERADDGRMYVIHAWLKARKVVRSEVAQEELEQGRDLRLQRVYRYRPV